MSVPAAERLHILAHRAAHAARDVGDRRDPLETALACIASIWHSRAYQAEGKRELERLLQWWREGQPRRTSADTAALALTARAAADLVGCNLELLAAATNALDDLAGRDRSNVPALHLALCGWALDPLQPDRDATPWPSLRQHLEHSSPVGVEAPLHRYLVAVSQRSFDELATAQELAAKARTDLIPRDACIVLWLVSAVVARLSRLKGPSDHMFRLLVQRRAELAEALVVEIDEGSFYKAEVPAFGDENYHDVNFSSCLSIVEALILDLALASRAEVEPWLTFEESERLFDARTVNARYELESTRSRLFLVIASLILALGLCAGTSLWLGMERMGVDSGVANAAAIATAGLILAISVSVSSRGRQRPRLMGPLGLFFVSMSVLAAVVAINQTMEDPLISDVGGLVGSAIVAAVPALVWGLIDRTAASKAE